MNKREIAKRLKVCKEEHGGEYNERRATVYGHRVTKTCIRIAGTSTWVFSPGVSVFETIDDQEN
jgi:hypothetical protein